MSSSYYFAMSLTRYLGLESFSVAGITSALNAAQRALNHNNAYAAQSALNEVKQAQAKEESRQRQKKNYESRLNSETTAYNNKMPQKLEERLLSQSFGTSKLGMLVGGIVQAHPKGITAEAVCDFLSSFEEADDDQILEILPKLVREKILARSEDGVYTMLNPVVLPNELPEYPRYPEGDERNKPLKFYNAVETAVYNEVLTGWHVSKGKAFSMYKLLESISYDTDVEELQMTEAQYKADDYNCKNKCGMAMLHAKNALDAMVKAGLLVNVATISTPGPKSDVIYAMKLTLD